MANQILAGAVFQAGMVIAGVDADNPPYVGPPAYWAETQYGVGGGGGGAWGNGSATAIKFNVMQNDTSGVDILTDIANNLDNNEVFKIEFKNSNKVVHSYDSPHRIVMNPNAPRDVPFYESTYWKSWQLNIMIEGSEAGNQHDPAKTLFDTYNPVNANDVTAPQPSIDVDPTGATNLSDLASFDQVIFYNQSGGAIVAMDLSYTRTGNGFDADGSASSATSLTSVTDPLSMPTTWTQAAGTSQDWNLEVVSGQAFSLTIDTGSGASTGVNLFDENGNYVYGWSQDWTLNIGWTPSSSGTYRIRFNSNPHHGDTTFTVTSTSGLA